MSIRNPTWLLIGGLFAASVHAQSGPDYDALLQAVQRLNQRVEQLERANQRLAAQAAQFEAHERAEALSGRLEDMEIQLLSMQKQTRMIETVEGVSAGASFLMVGQRASGGTTGADEGQLNYRADVSVTLPGGQVGEADGSIYAQFRIGQGEGLMPVRPTFTSTPNTTAFRLSNGDDSTVLLAQAWYQLDVPLNGGRADAQEHLEINFGKMDPFVFFDQNAVADDESARFLNNAFVHNPLLDSGGDLSMDAYGFAPGARIAYHNDRHSPDWWRVSLGAFGAGRGASFENSFSDPFLIAQLEIGRQFFPGRDGIYRLYTWTTGGAAPFANAADASTEWHMGWGLSVDQQLGESVVVFARYGRSTKGRVRFDQALTLGAEFGGAIWGRQHDRLGIAAGWLSASDDFQAAAPVLDADADGRPDFGHGAGGAERLAEVYYAWHLNDNFELSPDLQWISRPGGDGQAKDMTVVGLRARVGF